MLAGRGKTLRWLKKQKAAEISGFFRIRHLACKQACQNLLGYYVNGLRTFLTLFYFKRNRLAFYQSFESFTRDSAEVYKHVLAAVSRSNETKTFIFVKPLNGTSCF